MRLSGTVFSKVLDMDTNITVVTPNVLKPDGEYKVVYLLHGICGNDKTWLDYSLLPVYSASGSSIYVMPEAGRSFYTNMKYGHDYFTYVAEELPSICRSFFNISSKRENTIIMGGSMGGYGALKCALANPEQYGYCAAFSSGGLLFKQAFKTLSDPVLQKEYTNNFGEQLLRDFKAIFGENYVCNPTDDIVSLAANVKKSNVKQPVIYLTCGTEDPFYADHAEFCRQLDEIGINYEFEEWTAQHNFIYFNDALKKAIDRFKL